MVILLISLKKDTDFDDKLKIINKKITSNKSKDALVENKLKKVRILKVWFIQQIISG